MTPRLLRRPLAATVLGATLLAATTSSAQQAPPATDSPILQPAPLTAEAASAPESATDWQLLGGIAGLTVGAAFAAMGIYATVRVNEINDDAEVDAYRSLIPSNRNACEAARAGESVSDGGTPDPGHVADLCDEAESLQTLQGIAIPTAVVVGLAGWVLVGTSDTWCGLGDDLAVSPWLGPEGGGLGISARF
ncbi:MAG: hypothetical protein JRI68_20280 [Deltaproteobacteria bacterium]|nr:hypothetical protein [Deltaproteobacteria bacterium]